MRTALVLARSADAGPDGTVDLVGAGLFTVARGERFVVVSFIEVPAELADVDHVVRIDLLDDVGGVVGPPITKSKKVRARGSGSRPTFTAVTSTVKAFDHPRGTYQVRLSIDGVAEDGWRCGFVCR